MGGAIWLASYPKSGNTWARLILHVLRHGEGASALATLGGFGATNATYEVLDHVLGVDAGHLTYAEIDDLRPDLNTAYFGLFREPVPCKVHDAWSRLPDGRALFDASITHTAIYLVRDPRDIAVSWARFTGWGIDRAIDMLADPAMALDARPERRSPQLPQRLRSWSQHVASWLNESGLEPLVLRYEDMLSDPAAAARSMADAIGWEVSDRQIAEAIEATRFEMLAEQERRHGFLERANRADRFFRAGTSGQWRRELTPQQAARIERDHGAAMQRLGYC